MMQYVQDYDETFPAKFFSNPGTTYWFQLIQPYVKSEQIFICPSSGKDTWGNGQYAANTLFLKNATDQHPKLSSLQSAASIYMIMDGGSYQLYPSRAITSDASWIYLPGMGEGGGTCAIAAATYPNNVLDCGTGRHFGGVNMLFADAHVKWLRSSVVVAEAKLCGTTNCLGTAAREATRSAWNPLAENS